ncbi:MAG: alanine racemase [Acidobacteria bacterium]|uniref:Alanine racemase n=1 Tax=Candidatus Polarisedimenticola svalbardensis TaxID=2886004 RepID=A0A8J7CKA4_9BACT|nr:alanine racemase [Candidatus Polarisedimenticola svalbardensis]
MPAVLDLPGPAALVDLDRLERNIRRMSDLADRNGVRLRPHVKTHKSVEIARLQFGGETGPVTVSTLSEAEHFAQAGFQDITYAVPLDPAMLDRAAALAERIDSLNLLIDHPDLLEAMERRGGRPLRCFLKVDCGYHRAGVDPDSTTALDLARRIAASSATGFEGILTHAGHAYRCRNRTETLEVAGEERDAMVRFAGKLLEAGIPVPEISIGSTPTLSAVDHLCGVTEIRPGNYVFFDRFQAAIGSCEPADIAFSVLGSVIGVYPDRSEFLINTGAMALSRDPGADHLDPGFGFGEVFDPEQGERPALGIVTSLSQEHAVVRADGATPTLGARVRVTPNHSCLTAGLFDRYYAVRGTRVEGSMFPCRGW